MYDAAPRISRGGLFTLMMSRRQVRFVYQPGYWSDDNNDQGSGRDPRPNQPRRAGAGVSASGLIEQRQDCCERVSGMGSSRWSTDTMANDFRRGPCCGPSPLPCPGEDRTAPGLALDQPSFARTEQPRTVTRDWLFDLAGTVDPEC